MLVLSLSPVSFSYPENYLPCFSGDVMSGVQVATELHYFVCIVAVNYWWAPPASLLDIYDN